MIGIALLIGDGPQLEGPNDIPELKLPGPNAFIPTNLDVAKREVAEVIYLP